MDKKMTTTLDKDYRLELPKELRGRAGFEAGIPLQVTFYGQGFFVMPFSQDEKFEAPAKTPTPAAGCYELNPGGNAEKFLSALAVMQKALEGEAERIGWKTEEDAAEYITQMRREKRARRQHACNA